MNKQLLLSLGLATASLTLTGQAATLLQTDFDTATIGANIATGNASKTLTGTSTFATNAATGISGNEEITFTTATSSQTFITTSLGAGSFAPAWNLNGGAWVATIQFTVEAGYELSLTDIQFSGQLLKSDGDPQEQNRTVNVDLTVGGSTYGSQQSVNNTNDPLTLSFTEASTLSAGTYGITITSAESAGGTNFGIDNFQLNGTIDPVPEPSSAALLGLGGLALIFRRRK